MSDTRVTPLQTNPRSREHGDMTDSGSSSLSERPVVIEAAITPIGRNAQDFTGTVTTALECLAAGASIIHYRHDSRLDPDEALVEMRRIGHAVLDKEPSAILYPGSLPGPSFPDRVAHFRPLATTGTIGMFPLNPGSVMMAGYDSRGFPVTTDRVGVTFDDAQRVVRLSDETGVPLTIGVHEPGNLRFALAYARAGKLPAGSMVKLYFAGDHSSYDVGKRALNFGLPPTVEALDAYLSMLRGTSIPWSVAVIGGELLETPLARYALERGGHLRVGVQDTAGLSTASNREMVEAAGDLVDSVGRPVASCPEARNVLHGYMFEAMD
ncbi:3-keto-5-aminohexanoate cleavage protein [Rhodococcus chondri]|uniref:3-keto-5-aminohexanoate cleavage protein n=1 Tax=Rhodococcus chondri TaxID=3065941 RepID=A0ABU7JMF3_9NOCA|nr:3-keto-5-aminohexanoate cleavage protein [Rhodococcus sp. CC-R104]MEE2030892.1 3-keto-5-aminohexanoate cleavage protein [Rhodococcus sp. CC-R104]